MATRADETAELDQLPSLDADEPTELDAPDGTDGQPTDVPALRLAFVVGFPTVAAAVMSGGIFSGASPRIWAAIAGIVGIAAATRVRSLRNPIVMNVSIALAIFFIGIVLAAPAGSFSDVVNLGPFLRDAIASGDVQRPPVEFSLGWRAILGWLMGGLGFAAAWIAIELRRPALSLLVPLPVVATAAISVPEDARVASGIVCLVLFAGGLGMLSGIEMGEGDEQRSLAYELRRAARALPMIGVITVVLVLLARANFLFPTPVYDPTQSARQPKTVPLSEVPDRVLFTVSSQVTGPWRMGSLDVYDGEAWLLPPFADNRIEEVPRDGILDSELEAGVLATFRVEGLDGAVLPGLPNLVGLVAEGPKLAYDNRTGVIRLSQGAIQPGLEYTVTAARIPNIEELRRADQAPPESIEGIDTQRFLDIPPPPPAVSALLARAPQTSRWDTLDFLRNELLDTVAATGAGTPVTVTPERVDDMLAGSREGSPYEIVAAQAMLARWAGIPARIGYGFDGGEEAGEVLEVRPLHGASFLEVYFTGFKWLPLIGEPRQANASFSNDQTQSNREILASDDFAVSVFVPVETDPRSHVFEQIRNILFVVLPIVLLLFLIYVTWPAITKAIRRSRRRSWAADAGPSARVALAYAEFRDLATDFGYGHEEDTPLMFLDRVVPDDEHTQLAWLVTRTLWGDLRPTISESDAAAAEELAGTLKRRLSQGHPWTLRAISIVSRLSLRRPYAPELDRLAKEGQPDAARPRQRVGADA